MRHLRTMYVYLYRLNGEPMYVGQTPCLEDRDYTHQTNWIRPGCPFDKFLHKLGRNKFRLKRVGECIDVPKGKVINALENQMMDKFGTYWPDSHKGWNFAEGWRSTVQKHNICAWLFSVKAGCEKLWADPAFMAEKLP